MVYPFSGWKSKQISSLQPDKGQGSSPFISSDAYYKFNLIPKEKDRWEWKVIVNG